jgi:hypothetical protein
MIGGDDMYKPMCRECYHQMAEEIARKEADHENQQDTITLRKADAEGKETHCNSESTTPEKVSSD